MNIHRFAPHALAVALGGALLAFAAPAQAHFLWAQWKPGSAPAVQVTFTEAIQEKTLADLLPRVKPDRVVTDSGEKLELKAVEGALESAVPIEAKAVGVAQKWGVLDREGNGKNAFLLQYYAKAARDAESAAQKVNLHVEVFARKQGDSWIVSVLHGSRPEAKAEVVVVTPGEEKPQTLTTDTRGEVRFQAGGSGVCAIRARIIEAESGTFEGKAYAAKRYYSSLTFPVGATNVANDPEAFNLLKSAHDSRCVMPSAFPGFTAQVVLNDDGTETTGTVTYAPGKNIEIKADGADEKALTWLKQTLTSAILHRRAGDFTQGDGKNALTFTDNDRSPLGRQIALNDNLKSYYRVKDNQITEVTRTMGDQRFTITMLENVVVEDGKYLPKHFTVTYFHAKTGAIERVETFSDSHAKFENAWIPTTRRVVIAANGGFKTRSYALKNLRLETTARASR